MTNNTIQYIRSFPYTFQNWKKAISVGVSETRMIKFWAFLQVRITVKEHMDILNNQNILHV